MAYSESSNPKEDSPYKWASKYEKHSRFELNDKLCADLLFHLFYGEYMFWVECGIWLRWIGHKWKKDSENRLFYQAIRKLPKVVRHIADVHIEPRNAGSKEGRKIYDEWCKYAGRVGNKERVSAAIAVLQTDHRMQVHTEQLDEDPNMLGCRNGVIDLETGGFAPFDDADDAEPFRPYITHSTEIEYDQESDMTDWLKVVLKICCGDEDLADWVRRAVGYSITGLDIEQVFFMCHGKGSNGKSTFYSMLRKALGDYSLFGNCEMIQEENTKQSDRPRPDLLRLMSKRLMLIDETKTVTVLNESLLKRLSGGTPIVARKMKADDYIEFEMNAKIWIAFNREPRVKGGDDGIWRRIKRVPMHAKFSKEDVDFDPLIKTRLEANLPSILRWAVEGAVLYHQYGLGECDAVKNSTEQYKDDQDVLAPFIAVAVEDADDDYIYTRELYQTYRQYCRDFDEHPRSILGRQVFDALLSEQGWDRVPKKGKNRTPAWVGRKLVYIGPDSFGVTH